MTLELMYGDSIAGRHHYMLLDGKEYPLNEQPVLGVPYDMADARKKANEILKQVVTDLPTLIRLQQLTLFLKFKWDRTI